MDPHYADFSVEALECAGQRGETHKHHLMVWAARRIRALEALLLAEGVEVPVTRVPPHRRTSGYWAEERRASATAARARVSMPQMNSGEGE